MNCTSKWLLALVFLFLGCFFLFFARHRFIDADEGFYLLASRLVMQHKVPYLDFFYQQTPLLPYAYGLWMKLFGISWFSARSFSAALTTILGLLIYEHVCHETGRWVAALAAVVLYVSSVFVFACFPVARTFSLAALFLFEAYVIVTRLLPAFRPWPAAVAGLLFGLSVDTRSFVAGLAPIFLWWIFRDSATGSGTARMLWFLGGFIVGVGPSLYLLAASPGLFLFDNLVYHSMIWDSGLTGDWKLKVHIARRLLFTAGVLQFGFLWATSLAAILALRMRRGATLLAILIALILTVICILPRPPFVDNLSMCVPFLIVAAVCAASNYITSLRAERPKQIAVLASFAVLATFVASSLPSLRRYLLTGDRVSALYGAADAPNWTLDAVSAVSQAIDQVAAPNEEIASFWPGYVFASKADPYPGFENNFSRLVSKKLTVEQRAKYHILAEPDIEAGFAAHTPRIAVFAIRDVCGDAPQVSTCSRILLSNGYTVVRTISGTSIFECCS
jgi:hypothetical protein